MQELKIDPEFQGKIPPLTEAEFEQLKENILEAGEVYEPIVVWNGTIVDGHNRWKIIQENPGLIWKIKEIDFLDKWAAFDWMYKNQLGRRNLTEAQRTYLLGKLYEARKQTHGGDRKSSSQNGNLIRASEQIATEQGISKNKVIRAGHFSEGVDAIREASPEAADSILRGETKATKQDVAMVAKAEPAERQRMIEQIERGEKVTPVEVPDKMVNKPKAKYEGGGTAEYRDRRDKIAQIVADMYDPEVKMEYGINELLTEIQWSADIYANTLRNTVKDHLEIAKANKEAVCELIDNIIKDIEKAKGEMDK